MSITAGEALAFVENLTNDFKQHPEHLSDYSRQVFDYYDTNSDGNLDKNELLASIHYFFRIVQNGIPDDFNIDESMVDEIMDKYDTNHDGVLDPPEYTVFLG
eukprot:TRINITY_DN2673_c0_g1_i2.p1 TRINITY_DN2673_c0_g1~~TRINITY_DN2673_c0_g1_i2.p1  ORF type:complete len:112 (+),score=16.64 TRINITY_DN2673_c0_g1_i2:33-338(+)